ncbi:hypothetical protein BJ165DRAFT_127381 [Panaeolus papilionaceus]|nr:hypothetical protein BJ165DRAFT_127381 [Panaeolus papilionaceus]
MKTRQDKKTLICYFTLLSYHAILFHYTLPACFGRPALLAKFPHLVPIPITIQIAHRIPPCSLFPIPYPRIVYSYPILFDRLGEPYGVPSIPHSLCPRHSVPVLTHPMTNEATAVYPAPYPPRANLQSPTYTIPTALTRSGLYGINCLIPRHFGVDFNVLFFFFSFFFLSF